MKRIELLFCLSVVLLLMVGCKDERTIIEPPQSFDGGEAYYSKLIMMESGNTSAIPVLANYAIYSFSISRVFGDNLDSIEINYDLSDDYIVKDGYFLYYLTIETKEDVSDDIEVDNYAITGLEVIVNEEKLLFSIGNLEYYKITDIERGNEIIFDGSPVCIPYLNYNYSIEFHSSDSIVIEDIYFTNDLEIKEINDVSLEEYLDNEKVINSTESLLIKIDSKNAGITEYSTVATDFIIKYRVVDTNEVKWQMAPSYLTIHGDVNEYMFRNNIEG